ncbi:HAD family hydrolase [Congregibacter litoralis]|uniref:HAD-superfamily subfamily IB hydrolase n=1 Tax=Congregibacter litoralis KT71 TaxID=314285 RepID=A4ABX8_9GAMM|nr:HAD family hydrolase [Congregibacter litoralis]EAQ96428.1 HAD-superfamily subfamily IB hydrolase [Congregibacter litoralis KT71]
MTLAIFDLDNTLIAGDSDHLWGEFLCTEGLVDAETFRAGNEQFYADYQRGALDIEAYLAFALAPLAGRSPDALKELQTKFIRECIRPIMLPAATSLLKKHRQRGDRLLIITATNEFVTTPIARELGVDELLGCAVEIEKGLLTGRPTGTLTYREGKVKRLKEWLNRNGETLEGACFYSDSHNDLPLLEVIDNPVVVDGDPTLTAIAAERGWPRISLRR